METNKNRSCENCKFKDRLITEEPCMNCRDVTEPMWHDNWEAEDGDKESGIS